MATGEAITAPRVSALAVLAATAFVTAPDTARGADGIELRSPGGKIKARVFDGDDGQLFYSVTRGGIAVIEDSPLGITVDGAQLALRTVLGPSRQRTVDERYPWRGVKSEAVDHCSAAEIAVRHVQSGVGWTIEARAYDDGFAFRYVVPGEGARTVNGECTAWRLPEGSAIWFQTETRHYEAVHQRRRVEEVADGTHMGPPVTVELPDGTHAAITEANLLEYSGMTVRATGSAILRAAFQDNPRGWQLEGEIRSPWRVVMTGPGLDDLVNCDIVPNVSDPPDPELFPQGMRTAWVRPGRSLWNWWSASPIDHRDQSAWVDAAARMGYEFHLVDAGWEENWHERGKDKWELLDELTDYARARGVAVSIWKHWSQIAGAETRRDFLRRCAESGAAGVKVDFLDSESLARVRFIRSTLRIAAENRLLVNFHGAPKPTGEPRTFPNEVTREGIMGLEYNKWSALPPHHYCSLPFTRLLAGHGDFTPTTFQPNMMKGTTPAFQLASAVVFTSPLLHWADKHEVYAKSPACEFMTTIPSTWDETRVLPCSRIGELAAFARRGNGSWFLGVMNAGDARTLEMPLQFLADGPWRATLVKDARRAPGGMAVDAKSVRGGERLSVDLPKGGGLTARFSKLELVPHGGAFSVGREVRAETADRSADVRYTLDGTEPTRRSRRLRGEVALAGSCTLRARIVRGDGAGTEVLARFVKVPPPAPEIRPRSALLEGPTEVRIEAEAEAGADVRYTLDGSEPDQRSKRYAGPFEVDGDATVRARVFAGEVASSVVTRAYRVLPPVPPKPDVHLSDLKPSKATAGWGGAPKKDRSIEGKPLRVAGMEYARGMGTHAASEIVLALEPRFRRFVAVVGVDDEIKGDGRASVAFEVHADGNRLAGSPVVRAGGKWHFDVALPAGARELRLVATGGEDGVTCDHADWVDAGFVVK